jgi:hypothetical protein
VAILFLEAGVAGKLAGQQVCRTPTPAASAAVDWLLAPMRDTTWLRAHGIRATKVADLTPLTDSTDAPRCRQLNAYFARPVYFWRAGAYTIASDRTPLLDAAGVMHLSERATVFVLDSAGDLVFPSGSP